MNLYLDLDLDRENSRAKWRKTKSNRSTSTRLHCNQGTEHYKDTVKANQNLDMMEPLCKVDINLSKYISGINRQIHYICASNISILPQVDLLIVYHLANALLFAGYLLLGWRQSTFLDLCFCPCSSVVCKASPSGALPGSDSTAGDGSGLNP